MRFDLEKLEFVDCEIDKDKLAISGSDKDLTWGEFKIEVEKLKKEILSYNLPQGHPIVIYGHKEVKFIISMVACMTLKMPYIPVDTIYPIERLNKIINIVSSSLLIHLIDNKTIFNKSKKNTNYDLDDQIIYIIFTSGSTGEPKGVQITKSAILDFKLWLKKDFQFSDKNIYMNQAPFSFDLSVYEMIGFLLFAGTIILNNREIIYDYSQYFNKLKKYNCNTWVSTPSFISKFLLSDKFTKTNLSNLKQFIFCGEVLSPVTVKKIHYNFSGSQILNTYGPTEATVATTILDITPDIINKYPKILPIGYVKENTKIELLNIENGIGEIQLIGDNVSIGYFNNEDLNKEKFTIVNNKKAFNTGDYGYFEDGMLFFSGRRDDLVKLHGFRIETTEIDSVIIDISNIEDSITIPLKRGIEVVKLITFIISKVKCDVYNIKKTIETKLPYYMVPADIIQIDIFPYNVNHKIDKQELIKIYKEL
jgi:D-alanine--poly(phosphoribitol) ligase subunit 1